MGKLPPIKGPCVWCRQESQGNYAIHRDGFGDGPEVPLCDRCGGYPVPTCEEIWERIREDREGEAS